MIHWKLNGISDYWLKCFSFIHVETTKASFPKRATSILITMSLKNELPLWNCHLLISNKVSISLLCSIGRWKRENQKRCILYVLTKSSSPCWPTICTWKVSILTHTNKRKLILWPTSLSTPCFVFQNIGCFICTILMCIEETVTIELISPSSFKIKTDLHGVPPLS